MRNEEEIYNDCKKFWQYMKDTNPAFKEELKQAMLSGNNFRVEIKEEHENIPERGEQSTA